jgi:orotidine-5'-phosphate decarboxylase
MIQIDHHTHPTIYCAIDTGDLGKAKELSQAVAEAGCGVKLGLEFFVKHGADGVNLILQGRVKPSVFLDLKFHDIPNTVAGAVKSASSLDVAYLNIHATGGREMMEAAQRACAPHIRLLAVTILTSLSDFNILDLGMPDGVDTQVHRLTHLAMACHLSGVVCSPQEVKSLRNTTSDKFVLMVPGIRPEGSDMGDQKRTMTPKQAMEAGATHLVIGRPITEAKDPVAEIKAIYESLA